MKRKQLKQCARPIWRCAACDHRGRFRLACPKCKSEDVFAFDTPADRQVWTDTARENADAKQRAEMADLCYPVGP